MRSSHSAAALSFLDVSNFSHDKEKLDLSEKWFISRHTIVSPTDAYGTIEFQGLFVIHFYD